jgi:gliding motility-associated-like protein
MGLDFPIFPDSLVFPPGVDTIKVKLIPVADNLKEDPESIQFKTSYVNEFGDTIIRTANLSIKDNAVLDIIEEDMTISCLEDSILLSVLPIGAAGNFTLQWNNGAFGNSIYAPGSLPWAKNYIVTMTDECNNVFKDTVNVNIENPPIAQISIEPNEGCNPLGVTISNTSQNATKFHWDFGNGQKLDMDSTASQSQTYTESTKIQLVAYQGYNCSDTTYAMVLITMCGCTDTSALNYDPLAKFDNGTCVYPNPTIVAPNVFTPNGDGSNDVFFLNASNASTIELVILNRWGNVVFEMKGINPGWNGKTVNGDPVSDGVYFYKYTVTGSTGKKLEGHGFIELIR